MKQRNVLVGFRLSDAQVQQIESVHPGVRVHLVAEEIGALLGRGARGVPGLGEATDEAHIRAESRLTPLLEKAEVFFGIRVLPDLVARSPHLRWVQLVAHGIDQIRGDIMDGGVIVTTGRGNYASVIAEHVLLLMLMLMRQVPLLMAQQGERRWQLIYPGEMHGKVVGLVGLGSIGMAVARAAQGFGMQIMAVKRTAFTGEGFPDIDQVMQPESLNTLLGSSDFVVLGVPLTAETRGLIGREELRAMKPSAYLINVARGGVMDDSALVEALREGWIAGAGLDVFEEEPLPARSPLWTMPNAIITPHMAGLSDRFVERGAGLFCDNL
ncbi:MAG: D-2-hydroxyacid dehydrogenase, partial [Dehalococcoidia bacterium]|nr:D-2-hydroxyacid dehydrogenase [Dehalococcoidia bacterium]